MLKKAISEMVPDLVWAPDFFGSQMKMLYNDFQAENKFLGDQISQQPKKSGVQMRSGTISVLALKSS